MILRGLSHLADLALRLVPTWSSPIFSDFGVSRYRTEAFPTFYRSFPRYIGPPYRLDSRLCSDHYRRHYDYSRPLPTSLRPLPRRLRWLPPYFRLITSQSDLVTTSLRATLTLITILILLIIYMQEKQPTRKHAQKTTKGFEKDESC